MYSQKKKKKKKKKKKNLKKKKTKTKKQMSNESETCENLQKLAETCAHISLKIILGNLEIVVDVLAKYRKSELACKVNLVFLQSAKNLLVFLQRVVFLQSVKKI